MHADTDLYTLELGWFARTLFCAINTWTALTQYSCNCKSETRQCLNGDIISGVLGRVTLRWLLILMIQLPFISYLFYWLLRALIEGARWALFVRAVPLKVFPSMGSQNTTIILLEDNQNEEIHQEFREFLRSNQGSEISCKKQLLYTFVWRKRS